MPATRGRVSLTLEAKDFGPVTGCSISLKPLTLFIGPNNSGKSYVATLIHALFQSVAPHFPGRFSYWGRPDVRFDSSALWRSFPDQKKLIDDLRPGTEADLSPDFVSHVVHKTFEVIHEHRLAEELVRSFASPLKDLVRIGTRAFSLNVALNSYVSNVIYQKGRLKLQTFPRVGLRLRLTCDPSSRRSVVSKTENRVTIDLGRLWRDRPSRAVFSSYVVDFVLDIFITKMLESIAAPCYYLPAARSGILQAHKALAASIVRKSPYAGIEDLEIPRLSGIVSDFISSLITLPAERGPFAKLAQRLERDLIKGEIVLRTPSKAAYPEIKYKVGHVEIPLQRSSSSVSELAPLLLFLKHTISPGSVLLIEEPEAHLHPENQRIVARYLVKLVRGGVTVVVTTHSDYLIAQLNSFLLLGRMPPQERAEIGGYEEGDFLTADDIAAYVFKRQVKEGEPSVSDVIITDEDGISDEEFLKIHEALYAEAIRVRRELEKGK